MNGTVTGWFRGLVLLALCLGPPASRAETDVARGRSLATIMPWRAYAEASDADLHALAACLKTVPAVTTPDQTVPPPSR